MEIIKTPIEGLLVIKPRIFEDDRGHFFESWSKESFKNISTLKMESPVELAGTFLTDSQPVNFASSATPRVLWAEAVNTLEFLTSEGVTDFYIQGYEEWSRAYLCDEAEPAGVR